jgi:hypothetical protein
LFGITGLALFVVGSTHWGRFFFFGLGMLALAPVSAWWREAAPVLYGVTTALTMFYWAYAVKVLFGGFEMDPLIETDSASVSQWRLLGRNEFSPGPTRQATP